MYGMAVAKLASNLTNSVIALKWMIFIYETYGFITALGSVCLLNILEFILGGY